MIRTPTASLLLALCGSSLLSAQTPLPEPPLGPVPVSPVTVRLAPFAQLPATAASGLRARLSMLHPDANEAGVLWVNDLRGPLYRLNGTEPTLYLDLRTELMNFTDSPGLGAGFQSFVFHPDFAGNGRFYTVHTEGANSGTPDYIGPLAGNGFVQGVVTEWTATDPAAVPFAGSRREILRIAFPHQIHGIQEVAFNPNAGEGHPDRGLLYISVGDGGSFNVNQSGNLQRLDGLYGSVLRIDPNGTDGPNGAYGIPADNPFFSVAGARPEIFAYGFRNPHRIVFQPAAFAADPENPFVFVNDIGERNFEEVNLLEAGANYGWPLREGTYRFRGESTAFRDLIYPLPANDAELGFTYPIAQWDRTESNGRAIGSGIFYYGNGLPDLHGHYIMGNIPEAELYHLPVSAVRPGEQAPVYELLLGTATGTERISDRYSGRVDIRLGVDHDGEILVLVKADGRIYRLESDPLRWRSNLIRNGWVGDVAPFGNLFVHGAPWLYSPALKNWLYWPLQGDGETGGDWIYLPRP